VAVPATNRMPAAALALPLALGGLAAGADDAAATTTTTPPTEAVQPAPAGTDAPDPVVQGDLAGNTSGDQSGSGSAVPANVVSQVAATGDNSAGEQSNDDAAVAPANVQTQISATGDNSAAEQENSSSDGQVAPTNVRVQATGTGDNEAADQTNRSESDGSSVGVAGVGAQAAPSNTTVQVSGTGRNSRGDQTNENTATQDVTGGDAQETNVAESEASDRGSTATSSATANAVQTGVNTGGQTSGTGDNHAGDQRNVNVAEAESESRARDEDSTKTRSGSVDQDAQSEASATSTATATQATENFNLQTGALGRNEHGDQENINVAKAESDSSATSEQRASQSGSGDGDQSVDQQAGATSTATSTALAEQTPTNFNAQTNANGDNKAGDQANRNTAVADSESSALTRQHASQTRASGDGEDTIAQESDTSSTATAAPTAFQLAPTNINGQEVTAGEGDNTAGRQTNANQSVASAESSAKSEQYAKQRGDQVVTQDANTTSTATATPVAAQDVDADLAGPDNLSAQVTPDGDNTTGDQTMANTAKGSSKSEAASTQRADQTGWGDQTVEQDAITNSTSTTEALGVQGFAADAEPSNTITQGSLNGDSTAGDQRQYDVVESESSSRATSDQSSSQQHVRGDGNQSADQWAETGSTSNANATGTSLFTTNQTEQPVGILSGDFTPNDGDNRAGDQSNVVRAESDSDSYARSRQDASQSRKDGDGDQEVVQYADTTSSAGSVAFVDQFEPRNEVLQASTGDDRTGDQANVASADADARSGAETDQRAAQRRDDGAGEQSISQTGSSESFAVADADVVQTAPVNAVTQEPGGRDRSGDQANVAVAKSDADSSAKTRQDASQKRDKGPGGQAIFQDAGADSTATSTADVVQDTPVNARTPADGDADDRRGDQANVAWADAGAWAAATTWQRASQSGARDGDATVVRGDRRPTATAVADANAVQANPSGGRSIVGSSERAAEYENRVVIDAKKLKEWDEHRAGKHRDDQHDKGERGDAKRDDDRDDRKGYDDHKRKGGDDRRGRHDD